MSARAFEVRDGDHIVFLGNTFAERMQGHGFFESLLHYHFVDQAPVVRNMGWSADELTLMPRPLNFGELETHLSEAKADLIFLCFGMNESFKGAEGVREFADDLADFVDRLSAGRFNGESPPRLVLVSPIAHENLGGFWPDPAAHNADLALYTEAMEEVARAKSTQFVDLFRPTLNLMRARGGIESLTINGIHLNGKGYAMVSRMMADQLEMSLTISERSLTRLRELVVAKNKQFFLRWRPVNAEYIFGRRKEPFGVLSYPPEMMQLDSMIRELDLKISQAAKELRAQP